MLPIAVDAMVGDHAPDDIVAGARSAAAAGTPVVLVGPADLPDRVDTGGLPLVVASEVVEMDEDGGRAVRRKKDSSLV
ncbi:MAG: phosphate acyltransferase, partial [Ilumatobacteraceae bacterium]